MKHPDTARLNELIRRLKLGDGMPLGWVPSFTKKRWLARTKRMRFFGDPRKAIDALLAERKST